MGFALKASFAILFSALLLAHFVSGRAESMVEEDGSMMGRTLLATINCGAECARRCSLSSRPNLCNRACGTCCARCNCVPPGTAGNREVCPCYARMTTHGGRLKCP